MELEHIKEETCFECGAITESENRKNQHTNGLWNEERTFVCGKTIHHYPNFTGKDSIAVTKQCSRSAGVIKRDKLRRKLVKTLRNIIEESKVDDNFKVELYRGIPYEYV